MCGVHEILSEFSRIFAMHFPALRRRCRGGGTTRRSIFFLFPPGATPAPRPPCATVRLLSSVSSRVSFLAGTYTACSLVPYISRRSAHAPTNARPDQCRYRHRIHDGWVPHRKCSTSALLLAPSRAEYTTHARLARRDTLDAATTPAPGVASLGGWT